MLRQVDQSNEIGLMLFAVIQLYGSMRGTERQDPSSPLEMAR